MRIKEEILSMHFLFRKRQKDRHPDGPSAREKVYEEMQDNLLSLKSSLAFEHMISPFVKKVCRNVSEDKIYFINDNVYKL